MLKLPEYKLMQVLRKEYLQDKMSKAQRKIKEFLLKTTVDVFDYKSKKIVAKSVCVPRSLRNECRKSLKTKLKNSERLNLAIYAG